MGKLPVFLIICAMFVFPNKVFAQLNSNCNFTSFKDQIKFDRSFSRKLDFLHVIDKRMFDSMKNDSSFDAFFSGSFGLFDGNATFSEFAERRSRFFEKTKYRHSLNSSTSYATKFLSDNGLTAYQSCLEANRYGLFVQAVRTTDTLVEVSLLWKPNQNAPSNININVSKLDGIFSGGNGFPTTLRRGQRKYVNLIRNPNEDFYLKISSPKASDQRVLVGKQYVTPANIRAFHTMVWADANSYNEAPNRYVNLFWVADLIGQKYHRELHFTFSHGGQGKMFTDIRPDKTFRSWIKWRNQDFLDPSWRNIGETRVQLTNCGTPLACNYWISTKRIE